MSNKHVAFLRGINVGGHKRIKMAELKVALKSLGLKNIKTLLASGNVIFEMSGSDTMELKSMIEDKIVDVFGFQVDVIVRNISEILGMVNLDPFGKVDVTTDTRLYVTLLPNDDETEFEIPYRSTDGTFQILDRKFNALFSVCKVINGRLSEEMKIIEKSFGKKVTTRDWKTILKVAALA